MTEKPTPLETLIQLRPLGEEDYPLVLSWNRQATLKDQFLWAGPSLPFPLDESAFEKLLQETREPQQGLSSRLFIIECIEAQQNRNPEAADVSRPVGLIGLGRIDQQHKVGRLGRVLIGNPRDRGKGYAFQAVRKVLEIGFVEEKLHKITLGVFDFNQSAINCYLRAGFHREGLLRDHYLVEGEYWNLVEMSILFSEWQNYQNIPMDYFETGRLLIRNFTEADAQLAAAYHQRNRDFLYRWSPLRDESFYTVKGQRDLIQHDLLQEQSGRGLRLWIFRKEHHHETIGNMSLSQIVGGHFSSGFLGYQLDKDMLRQGYMKEALQVLLKEAFKRFELHRIEANIMTENHASRALIESLGFTLEGNARKYLNIRGRWEDHLHYVLLREDWMEFAEE